MSGGRRRDGLSYVKTYMIEDAMPEEEAVITRRS